VLHSRLKKIVVQILSKANTTGILFSKSAVLKCSYPSHLHLQIILRNFYFDSQTNGHYGTPKRKTLYLEKHYWDQYQAVTFSILVETATSLAIST
jgi:hypothetical protein